MKTLHQFLLKLSSWSIKISHIWYLFNSTTIVKLCPHWTNFLSFVVDERFAKKWRTKEAKKRMFVLKLSISKLSSFIRNLFRISINVRERCIYLMEAFIRIFLGNIVRKWEILLLYLRTLYFSLISNLDA